MGKLGPGGRWWGGDAISGVLSLEGHSLGACPHIQDVDSRDRRRRELEQPERQEPPEQREPSTSWWPVSSAEKKKNITLVRGGKVGYRHNGGVWWGERGCWGMELHSVRGVSREAGLLRGVMDSSHHTREAAADTTSLPTLPSASSRARRSVSWVFDAPHIYTQDNVLYG